MVGGEGHSTTLAASGHPTAVPGTSGTVGVLSIVGVPGVVGMTVGWLANGPPLMTLVVTSQPASSNNRMTTKTFGTAATRILCCFALIANAPFAPQSSPQVTRTCHPGKYYCRHRHYSGETFYTSILFPSIAQRPSPTTTAVIGNDWLTMCSRLVCPVAAPPRAPRPLGKCCDCGPAGEGCRPQ